MLSAYAGAAPETNERPRRRPEEDWLHWRAQATPRRTAIIFEGRSVTYAELDRLADGMAAALSERRVGAGDRVAAVVGNSIEAIALIHAAARARAVLAPLNTRLTAGELRRQLELLEPALLVCDEKAGAAGQEAGFFAGVELRQPAQCVGLAELGLHALKAGDRAGPAGCARGAGKKTRLQSIVFTSGTTGTPKGVMLSYDNHFWSAAASAFRLGTEPDDRWLTCLPLYHVGGLAIVFRSCLYGTAIVLQTGFAVEAFGRSLREEGVTLVSLVPTMLHRLLESGAGTAGRGRLRAVLLGGAAAGKELLQAAREAGFPVAATYGLTETASQAATALPAEVGRKPGGVGKPLMFVEARVGGGNARAAAAGEVGEIRVRGPQVMAGYFGNPQATEAALCDGWLRTGDMGYFDDEGDLFVVQRRRDMIVSGGENIYPAEVEAVLRSHASVADACVVGLPDAEWGQRCAAAVQLQRGQKLGREALLAYSRERLAGYKLPSAGRIRFVEGLPQTASGKIARRAVERLLAEFGTTGEDIQR